MVSVIDLFRQNPSLEPDPRTDSLPLMKAWGPSALISLTYVVGVCAWRAEIVRKQRKQLQDKSTHHTVDIKSNKSKDVIQYVMIIYNICMVIFSTFVTIGVLWGVLDMNYGVGCERSPDPTDRRSDRLLFFGYLFYVSKFVEMLDTMFFLLRGKVDQVSFLHVFHHASMPPSVWWGVKYAPGGMNYVFPLMNSFIHILMYVYYGLAAAGATPYLWWKRYLTLAQMIQFIFLVIHQGQVFVRSEQCDFPAIFPAATVIYGIIFFALFTNFYIKAYWHKGRLAKSDNSRPKSRDTPYSNGRHILNCAGPSGNSDKVRTKYRKQH